MCGVAYGIQVFLADLDKFELVVCLLLLLFSRLAAKETRRSKTAIDHLSAICTTWMAYITGRQRFKDTRSASITFTYSFVFFCSSSHWINVRLHFVSVYQFIKFRIANTYLHHQQSWKKKWTIDPLWFKCKNKRWEVPKTRADTIASGSKPIEKEARMYETKS